MSENPTPEVSTKKLQTHEHLIAGLPIALVVVGGAIGGAIGGGAYAINASIFKRDISTTKKYIYSFLVSIAACAAYAVLILILAIIFPGLFKK